MIITIEPTYFIDVNYAKDQNGIGNLLVFS